MKKLIRYIKEVYIWFYFKIQNINLYERKKVFICDVAMYGNLGDQAIIYAEKKFLHDYYKDIKIIEVSSYIFDKKRLYRKFVKLVKNDDILFIHGGGSLDDRASKVVRRFCRLVEDFKHHRIVMFPQTMSFSNSKESLALLEEMKHSFHKHKDLVLCAREKISYDLMKNNFPEKQTILVPDIVLYLKKYIDVAEEEKILCLFRDDVELTIKKKEKMNIKAQLSSLEGYEVIYSDTVRKRKDASIKKSYQWNRNFFLKKIWREIASSKLVVTDRLHGMIFAVITGTPVILLPSLSHKIRGVYEWVSKLSWVVYLEDLNNLQEEAKSLLNQKVSHKKRLDEYNFILDYYPLLKEIEKGDLNELQK